MVFFAGRVSGGTGKFNIFQHIIVRLGLLLISCHSFLSCRETAAPTLEAEAGTERSVSASILHMLGFPDLAVGTIRPIAQKHFNYGLLLVSGLAGAH